MSSEPIALEEARARVLAHCEPLDPEPIPLERAMGRTVAAAVRSSERVPGFDNSAMDGFAVRAADVAGAAPSSPSRLKLVGESRAGAPADRPLGPAEAIAISTGAALPRGADAVVRVEDTSTGEGAVEVLAEVAPGANIRRAGEDVEPGTVLIEPGTMLGAAELGVLASVGVAEPQCRRRPRVAILTTGDELIAVGEPLRPGAVRNSNGLSLPALAIGSGADPLSLGTVGDQPARTAEAVEKGLEADVLVVCGGVSVGEHDHVKAALHRLGVKEVFWRVALKPGKPAFFGTAPGTLVFGLPGNPVSAFVTFLLLVRPALLALVGADPAATRIEATITDRYEKPADRAHAIRCGLELGPEGWLASPAPHQGSHVMTSLLGADGLALIGAERTAVGVGERVTVELIER